MYGKKGTCIRTRSGTWGGGLELYWVRFMFGVVAVQFAAALSDNVKNLVEARLDQAQIHRSVVVYEDELPVVAIEPVDSKHLLSGADGADVGEEVLVMSGGGEGELSEYLPAVHQTSGESDLYL